MDTTLGFFNELLKMVSMMVNDVMPDMLLHLDQQTLETLMNESQLANNSLQVFTMLCGIISRKNLSRSGVTPELEGPSGEAMSVDSVQPSQPPEVSPVDESIVSNFSDLPTHSDDVWKGLLTEARIWCLRTYEKKQLPLYYCGVCNKQAKAKHIWEAHIGGKNHVKLVANVDAIKCVCGTCGLHVYGTIELFNKINSSEEHQQYDLLFCATRPASPVDSVSSGPSCNATLKKQGPELSDLCILLNSESSNVKPSISRQSSTEDNAPNEYQNPEPAARKVAPSKVIRFQKTEIHNDFVDVTEIISNYIENHESFAIGYCRPCEIICESKLLWNVHKKTPKHIRKMSSKLHKNVLCRCLQCEFVVTAGLKIATTYMKYHIEYCHHQSTEGIKIEEYMEFKNVALDERTPNEPESKASSFKRSSETIYSVRSSVTDLRSPCLASDEPLLPLNVEKRSGARTPSSVVDRDVGQYAEQSTSTASSSRSTGKTNTTSANPYKSSSTKPPTDQVSDLDAPAQNNHSTLNDAPSALSDADLEFAFLQMLHKKEESFQKDTTFKLFTALCVVCKHANFSSQNAWNRHVLTHTISDSYSGREISCTQCDSRFFGHVGDIAAFMKHEYHVCIDAMFSW